MSVLIWIITALCLCAVFVYGRLSGEEAATSRFALRVLASLLFILLGVLCVSVTDGAAFYPLLVMTGLFFSFLADIASELKALLPPRHEACMLVSMCAYTLAHLFYIVLFSCIVSVGILALGVALASFLALLFVKRRAQMDFGALTMPLMAYSGVMCVLMGFAAHIVVYDMRLQTCMLALGAALLAFSSALRGYGMHASKAGFTGANAYYAGQILFALSIWLR